MPRNSTKENFLVRNEMSNKQIHSGMFVCLGLDLKYYNFFFMYILVELSFVFSEEIIHINY